jgi:hypothetical protein
MIATQHFNASHATFNQVGRDQHNYHAQQININGTAPSSSLLLHMLA